MIWLRFVFEPLVALELFDHRLPHSGMPLLGVYLVKPAARADAAAFLMCSGMSNPAPHPKSDDVEPLCFHLLGLGFDGQGQGGGQRGGAF